MRTTIDITRDDIEQSSILDYLNPLQSAVQRNLLKTYPNFLSCAVHISDSYKMIVAHLLGVGEFPGEDPESVRKYKTSKMDIGRYRENKHLIEWVNEWKNCFVDFDHPYFQPEENRKRKDKLKITSFELEIPDWLFEKDYRSDIKYTIYCPNNPFGTSRNTVYRYSFNSKIDDIPFKKFQNYLLNKYGENESILFDHAFCGVLPIYDMPYSIRGHYDAEEKKLVFKPNARQNIFVPSYEFKTGSGEIEQCVDSLMFSFKELGDSVVIIVNMENRSYDGTFRAGIGFCAGEYVPFCLESQCESA